MTTHAEQVQQAKDRVVAEAGAQLDAMDAVDREYATAVAETKALRVARKLYSRACTKTEDAAVAYRALVAATCPKCGGTYWVKHRTHPTARVQCPAKCDNGRKRDE